MADEVVYRSEVTVKRIKGPIRHAWLPEQEEPAVFGLHGYIAEHYKAPVPEGKKGNAATIDYIVAATAG